MVRADGITARLTRVFVLLIALCGAMPVLATEGPSCHQPRFSDVGWTDITATTAVATRILSSLGYAPKVQVLSVPVTYLSMKNKDIDIFLGNWMPTMEADRQPYLDNKSVEIVRPVLDGARFTMAVPTYAYDAGIKSFADIVKNKDKLGGKIYGLEPGNDGNRTVLTMIKADAYGLKDFDLVESSEQGMLAQVDRAVRRKQPIVFLAWKPHPMNQRFEITYLDDPTNTFGPDNGSATVWTNVRAGYLAECPNVAAFLKNYHYDVATESALLASVPADSAMDAKAIDRWLKSSADKWKPWIAGVTTADGGDAVSALSKSLGMP